MTSLLEQIQSDVKAAMKARDTGRVQTLRLFVNVLQNEAKSKQRDLEPTEEIQVLQRAKKKNAEAAEAFEAAGHGDRAAEERAQASIVDGYLPAPLSDKELRQLVIDAIAEVGAESTKDMGAVMKAVQPRVAGRADGKAVSGAVQAALNSGG